MSRYDLRYQMDTYTDDFGNTYNNIPVKAQYDAPALADIYDVRKESLCAPTTYFAPRHLVATFEDGRKLKYPIAEEDKVAAVAQLLKNNKAVCIDYVGEKWNLIFGTIVGGNLQYKTVPYENLVSSKAYEVGVFDYTSNLGLSGLTNVQLPFRVPINDNAELRECQKQGLENPKAGSGICAAKGLITARYYIIKATALDKDGHTGKVSRKALVSKLSELKQVALQIDKCSSCLGYQGESVKGLEALI